MNFEDRSVACATLQDVVHFQSLIPDGHREEINGLFGLTNLEWAFERSSLTLAVRPSSTAPIAGLVIFDSLLLSPVAPQEDLFNLLQNEFREETITSFNTMFLNFFWMIREDDKPLAHFEKALKVLFRDFSRLKYCAVYYKAES